MEYKLYIGICGLIGAGKTTLAEALGNVMKLPVHYEEVVENAYLEDFYSDMAKYAFPLQVHLLNKRFKQQQQIIWSDQGAIQDRTIYEDGIFAKMLMESNIMNARDYKTYTELFHNISNFMRRPNVIVYLSVSPEESLQRIQQRSRDMETKITIDYLRSLHNAYESFIVEISKIIPVIKVDWNTFHEAKEVATKILEEYAKIREIHSVKWWTGEPHY